MSLSKEVREFGARVKKEFAGYYIYNGVNFTAPFNIASCETTWWEVNCDQGNTDARIRNHFEDFNRFDAKRDLLYQLLQLDKSISDGSYEPLPNY